MHGKTSLNHTSNKQVRQNKDKTLAKSPTLKNVNARTMQEALRMIRWSLDALEEGVWPRTQPSGQHWPAGVDRDRAGTSLAEGFFGILVGVQGDLDWYGKTLGLPVFNNKKPCFLCHAENSDTDMRWNNFEANWEERLRDKENLVAQFPRCRVLMSSPSTHVQTLTPDWMHVKHLGIDQRFLASIIYLMIFDLSTVHHEVALEQVWNMVQDYYKAHGTPSRLSNLKLSMVVDIKNMHGDYPRMRGKASEMRHLTAAVLHAWKSWPKPQGHLMYRLVTFCLEISAELEERCNSYSGFAIQDCLIIRLVGNPCHKNARHPSPEDGNLPRPNQRDSFFVS